MMILTSVVVNMGNTKTVSGCSCCSGGVQPNQCCIEPCTGFPDEIDITVEGWAENGGYLNMPPATGPDVLGTHPEEIWRWQFAQEYTETCCPCNGGSLYSDECANGNGIYTLKADVIKPLFFQVDNPAYTIMTKACDCNHDYTGEFDSIYQECPILSYSYNSGDYFRIDCECCGYDGLGEDSSIYHWESSPPSEQWDGISNCDKARQYCEGLAWKKIVLTIYCIKKVVPYTLGSPAVFKIGHKVGVQWDLGPSCGLGYNDGIKCIGGLKDGIYESPATGGGPFAGSNAYKPLTMSFEHICGEEIFNPGDEGYGLPVDVDILKKRLNGSSVIPCRPCLDDSLASTLTASNNYNQSSWSVGEPPCTIKDVAITNFSVS